MRDTSTVEPRHLRACLSRFVTGVAVVSYRAEGEARGLTVNSFTSVSLEPPLVLVSVARTARAAAHLGRVPFSVNVLGAAQLDLALHFAGLARDTAEVAWQSVDDELAPTLAGALATLRCRPWRSYGGGDHRLHLGQVVQAEVQGDGEPLLFDRGGFSDLGALIAVASADDRAA
jgi:flavin reductase (DIM6/NTAB) family NADH-FMN oxidoreductase RutF